MLSGNLTRMTELIWIPVFVLTAAATGLLASPAPPQLPAERTCATSGSCTFGGENAEAYFSPDGTR